MEQPIFSIEQPFPLNSAIPPMVKGQIRTECYPQSSKDHYNWCPTRSTSVFDCAPFEVVCMISFQKWQCLQLVRVSLLPRLADMECCYCATPPIWWVGLLQRASLSRLRRYQTRHRTWPQSAYSSFILPISVVHRWQRLCSALSRSLACQLDDALLRISTLVASKLPVASIATDRSSFYVRTY